MISDKIFMNIANEMAKGSKCVSQDVGAVIVKKNRILSTGYNGTPAGYINCRDYWKGEYTKEHHDWSARYEIHAEMNAILWAARQGISIEGSTLYTVFEPCFQCTKNIIAAGIKKVVFQKKHKHNHTDEGNNFFHDAGVEIKQIGE